jgi:hypothetical protein
MDTFKELKITTLETATLVCNECGKDILAKSLFAHVILRHRRMPRPREVPQPFHPNDKALERLRPHINRLVDAFLGEARQSSASEKGFCCSSFRRGNFHRYYCEVNWPRPSTVEEEKNGDLGRSSTISSTEKEMNCDVQRLDLVAGSQ